MESDARALTILTIHKSKGLEFPIVFCPFCWESDSNRKEWPLFHDPAAGMRRTLYIGAEANTDYNELARTERLAESLRLLYVAITRAQSRCYLIWGDLPSAPSSALGYLLNSGAVGGDHRQEGDFQRPAEPATAKTAKDTATALELLAQKSGGTIAVTPPPEPTSSPTAFASPKQELRPERSLHRRLDLNWAIASFSSLIRGSETAGATPEDRDQAGTTSPPEAIGLEQSAAAQTLMDDIHLFPRGAHAGNLFHRLFEILDYRQTDMRVWQPRVASELAHYGFEPKWILPVTRLIRNVLTTPMPPETRPLSLNLLDPQACVKEMPFVFPLNRLRAEGLSAVFHHHDLPLSAGDLDRQLKKLNFSISGGYLRGFIDLVFHLQGRYYLLDWKSNYLGDTYADYDLERIRTVMAADYYFLQYHLYAVALDQFLRLRLPGYAYERDFGGVYYLFIRGMRPEHAAGSGIFHDRPKVGLIRDLRQLLLTTAN